MSLISNDFNVFEKFSFVSQMRLNNMKKVGKLCEKCQVLQTGNLDVFSMDERPTVNSLVSDHPWGTTKWSLTGGGRLRERSTK